MKTSLLLKSTVGIILLYLQSNFAFATIENSPLLLPPDSIENFTYLGSTNNDMITGVFRYSDYLVVCGTTYSGDSIPFPPNDSTTNNGTMNVFVSLMSTDLDHLYKTQFIMGSGDDHLTCAKINHQGKLILAGTTNSPDFPVSENAFQDSVQGGNDAFVLSFSLPESSFSEILTLSDSILEVLESDSDFYYSSQFALENSTLFGSMGEDQITAIDVDSVGNIYCLGNTNSQNLPLGLVENSMNFSTGNGDVFFAKFDSSLQTLQTSSIVGSETTDLASDIVIQDSLLFILFNSQSFDPSPFDSLQFTSMSGGNADAFLLTSDLDFSTILKAKTIGGSDMDFANSMLVKQDQIYIAGFTKSHNLPTTDSVPVPEMAILDTVQSFVCQFPISLDSISASTYLGGSATDIGYDLIAVGGYVYLTGITNSIDFQTGGSPFSYDLFGGYDVFVAKFDTILQLASATYLGDVEDEWMKGRAVITDNSLFSLADYNDYSFYSSSHNHMDFDANFVYLGANTWSNNFIIPFEHYDQLYNGALDMFLYRMKASQMTGGITTTGNGGGGGGNCSECPWNNVDEQPLPVVEICEGFDTLLVVSTSLPDSIFQWLIYDHDSMAWVDLVDDTTFQGSHNDTLFIQNFPLELSGVHLRCYIQNTFHYYRTTPSTIYAFTPNPEVLLLNEDSLFACPHDTININVEGALTYLWEDEQEGSSHSFVLDEEYSSFVVGSNLNCGSDTAFFTIQVFPEPSPILLTNDMDSVCENTSISLQVSGAESYLWFDGSSADSLIFIPDSTSMVHVQGFDINYCSSYDSTLITVFPFENVNFLSASSDSICLGDSIVLSADGIESIQWNSLDADSMQITLFPEANSTYIATATDENQCSATDSITIAVFQMENSDFLSTTNDSICLGDSTLLTHSTLSYFEWIGFVGSDSLTVFPTENTIYSALGIDEHGCSAEDSLEITVSTFENPGFLTASQDSICEGDSLILMANINSFEWSWTVIDEDTIVVTPLETTDFSAIGYDSNNCQQVASVTVTVLELPVVDYTFTNETCDNNNDGSIILNYEELYTILWENDYEGDSLLNLGEGAYHFWAIDNFGCSIDQEITIINDSTNCEYLLFVPTIFSPNQDGENDLLFVHTLGVDEFNFQLFNSWGQQVFQTQSTEEAWDGNYQGQPSFEGVYYYVFQGVYSNGESFTVQSDITLVR